ncbi:MAG: DNA-binding protein, partial [Methylobacter sp.]
MKEWRTRRQKITDAQRVPARGNIKDQANVFLNDFIATVWDTAKSEADNKLKAERQALSEAQAELEQETGEALEMAENLNAENLALKAKIQELENVRADDQKRINTMATQAGH